MSLCPMCPHVPHAGQCARYAGRQGAARALCPCRGVTCALCGRAIIDDGGVWIDPEATGDDSIWRETCDESETFTAEHIPALDTMQ